VQTHPVALNIPSTTQITEEKLRVVSTINLYGVDAIINNKLSVASAGDLRYILSDSMVDSIIDKTHKPIIKATHKYVAVLVLSDDNRMRIVYTDGTNGDINPDRL
jgi:predicted homoserine dehydrogenase-like protein